MVKSAETPVPVQQSKITITARITVPLMEYGNITLEATLERDLGVPDVQADVVIISQFERLKHDLALVILPMAEAEVTRAASLLLKESNPDYWMRKNSSVYRWLRLAEPELEIPAMLAILDSKSVPNSGLE